MTPAIARNQLRHLSCLGLSSRVAIPAMLRAMHYVVPVTIALFQWAGAKRQLCSQYIYPAGDIDGDLENAGRLYLSEFYNRRERDALLGFSQLLRPGVGPENFARYGNAYLRSDFHDAIHRPLGVRHAVRTPVRDGAGRGIGLLITVRGEGDKPFDLADERRLGELLPFFSHALDGRAADDVHYAEDEHGVLIVDRQGRIQHSSAIGRRLLLLATTPAASETAVRARDDAASQRLLRDLAQSLTAVLRGKPAASPCRCLQNGWGRFRLSAHWLDGSEPGDGLIAITVRHDLPLPARVAKTLGRHPLPPRQQELCLLLAAGLERREIAARMGISVHTVIDHQRAVYQRFSVHDRGALLAVLTGAAPEFAARD